MNFKNLFTEERAVSPVIGVILMVAITVILAAVIGTFVLGLGDQVSESAPQAQFSFDFADDGANATIDITHDGGDSISTDQLQVNLAGSEIWNSTGTPAAWAATGWSGDTIEAGSNLNLEAASAEASDGDAVRVIWSSSNSDKTATIGQAEFQS